MTFYGRMEETATRLIAKRGKSATLVKFVKSGPAHNPTINENPSDITLVETDYSLTNRNDSLVQVGDKLGIISTAGLAPAMADKIEIDGERYSFVDLQPLNPGGAVLLFEFLARK
ncbi:MAG: hypothetical protein CMN85_10615 [Spongiibacteraceae bacterium]|nr:hypothetical protein [Spongiibacteraceae bacterium]|tara:strand:+ start:19059 stop:19403 length:345 start_codon:yes stop_codon:yes gene_type:complete